MTDAQIKDFLERMTAAALRALLLAIIREHKIVKWNVVNIINDIQNEKEIEND